MFDAQQKLTGTDYTRTAALLIMAFVFSPAVLIISRRFGFVPFSLAVAFSVFCVVLAWIKWKSHSERTMPSISAPASRLP